MAGIERVLEADDHELPFLLIGGHAVVLHGFFRNTADLDLLIPEGSAESWQGFLEEAGYRLMHRTPAFAQFDGGEGVVPVDLMIVDEATFRKLAGAGSRKKLMDREVTVPAARHVIALKLHAIRQPGRIRVDKDWGDIVGLIRSCGLDLEDGSFQELIERYGGPSAENEIRQRLGG